MIEESKRNVDDNFGRNLSKIYNENKRLILNVCKGRACI